jgi:hypothetical protein
MFASPDVASVARLTLECVDEGDFNSLMSAMADVLGQVVTPGRVTPSQREALEVVCGYRNQAAVLARGALDVIREEIHAGLPDA